MTLPRALLRAGSKPDLVADRSCRPRRRSIRRPRRQLDRARLPLPHRRGDAGAAPALPDHRRADRRAGADPARHRPAPAPACCRRRSPASCSARASRSMRAGISSSCRTRIGHGKSSKPSDGLRAKFPRYNYDDMVAAQYRLVTEGLGVRHLRLVLGNSMGGMHTWIWGVDLSRLHGCAGADGVAAHRDVEPQLDDAAAASSTPSATIPDWNDGDYTDAAARVRAWPTCSTASPPTAARWPIRSRRRRASWPTSCSTQRLAAPFTADANDVLYQWDSSRDYNPSPGLERIQAALLADQLRRRRAQSAGDRHHGARAQAREERPRST